MSSPLLIPPSSPGAPRKRNVLDILESFKELNEAKNILIRVDFNVPMKDGTITDASRIVKALPTIRAVLDANHNAILMSHMGRPKLVQKGEDNEETRQEKLKLSLKPVADYLSENCFPDKEVLFVEDCLKASDAIGKLQGGGNVVLLENLRFYKEEEKNGEAFTQTLASYADAYINDAFGTSHRAHASVSGVPGQLDPKMCGIGSLVASELAYLDFSNLGPDDKVAAIIGGSKVSTKLPVIQGLLKSVDVLILGGGLAFTFLKAQGINTGNSLVEDGMIDTAKDLLRQAEQEGKYIVLPDDAVCSKSFPQQDMDKSDTETFDLTVESGGVQDGYMGLDVGSKTVQKYRDALKGCTKVVMNGPAGVFEVKPFDEGTRGLVSILEEITQKGTITVVGGGDSVAALEAFGKMDAVSYVSTGGGATLELLAGDELPGVTAIANLE